MANHSSTTFIGQINFSGTTNPGLVLNSLTTTQRDALTPTNGMLIYNTTTTTVQKYENGVWGDVSTGGSGGAPIDSQYVTLATDATLTNERVLTVGKHLSLTDAGAGSSATLEYIPTHEYFAIDEEFIGALVSSGNTGALTGFTLTNGSIAAKAGETNHPGMFTLSSTTTISTLVRLGYSSPGSGTTGSFIPADIASVKCIVRPLSGTTNMGVKFGLTAASAAGTLETGQGAYFSFDPATSANWRTVTRDGTGITANSSSVAYTAGNWYMLEIRRSGTSWVFYLNGTSIFTHTTNIPTAVCIPAFFIENTEAVAKTIDIDYFGLKTAIFGQRYT